LPLDVSTQVKDPERVRLRREQIVQASVRLFTEKGFHKTTTREIAKASGLSNGALYEYVQSKEDVLYLVCRHIHREVRNRLASTLTEPGSAAERLRHALFRFGELVLSMQDEILLIYQESKSLPRLYLHEVLSEEQQVVAVFEQLLREGLADKSILVEEKDIPVLAENAVVTGQMLAFRRWAWKQKPTESVLNTQVNAFLASVHSKTD
jgi:AcrR family transcriptional regulator